MARKKNQAASPKAMTVANSKVVDLLKDLLIAQLGVT